MPKHFKKAVILFFVSAVLSLVGVSSIAAQQNPKRLVLKDGSFQTVTQWEVKGDRVRYYSSERYGWEEIPASLVDWLATEKYNKERDAARAVMAGQVSKEEEEDRKAEDTRSPMVAPGLRLPDSGGVFLLDDFRTEPQLVELPQNAGDINKETGKNILRAAVNPIPLSSKQTVELKGAHAHIQSHIPQPVIYVNVAPTDDLASNVAGTGDSGKGQPEERYRIIRLLTKKDKRIVGNLNIGLTGNVTQKESWLKTTSSQVGDWTEVTPAEPLLPGEYALVEMLDKKQINLYVWDFTVDPAAPANPTAWTAQKQAQTVPDTPPKLQPRPK
ncbi:MAG TPA: hypothetical protein VKZ53_21155 [Candidatus Angelobacter sp.]|nr:hypothetical protein [Candidatus Angelobacter sp.]